MGNIDQEDSPNGLEVEITDLDTSYEGSKFVNACLQAQHYLAKIPWKPSRSSSLKLLLLTVVFFVPLFISTSYGPERVATTHSSSQSSCITRSEEVIISDGTVTTDTSVHVTIVVITQTANSSSSVITPKNVQDGSKPWQAGKDSSGACK